MSSSLPPLILFASPGSSPRGGALSRARLATIREPFLDQLLVPFNEGVSTDVAAVDGLEQVVSLAQHPLVAGEVVAIGGAHLSDLNVQKTSPKCRRALDELQIVGRKDHSVERPEIGGAAGCSPATLISLAACCLRMISIRVPAISLSVSALTRANDAPHPIRSSSLVVRYDRPRAKR